MRVLVCGSRTWTDADAIRKRLERLPAGTEIIHGCAPGADVRADDAARELGLRVRRMPADWKRYGRAGGVMRNLAMLDEKPDLVIAFWKDDSRGTGHVVREATRRGVELEIHTPARAA